MKIIHNDQERQQIGMPALIQLCGPCNEELGSHYPILFMDDRVHTGYHLACAMLMAASIIDAAAEYLLEASYREAENLSDMAKAFRAAAIQRGHHEEKYNRDIK
jgi:hypothetical protein